MFSLYNKINLIDERISMKLKFFYYLKQDSRGEAQDNDLKIFLSRGFPSKSNIKKTTKKRAMI